MDPDAIHKSALIVSIFAATALIFIPAVTTGMSKVPWYSSAQNSETSDGTACSLPPELGIERKGNSEALSELPSIDKDHRSDFKTATFALG
jgi:hypothetical protein